MQFDPDLLQELKALGVTVIGRVHFDDQPIDNDSRRTIAELLARARQLDGLVDWWEGYNEAYADHDTIGDLAAWEIDRMRAFDAAGLKARCLIGGFATGTPTLPDDPDPARRQAWPNFRPALQHALTHGHGLHLHEYSGPVMQWLAGANQWDPAANRPKRVDDPCTAATVDGYLTLRYRKLLRQCLQPWGMGALPIYITESGIDDVWPRPGPVGKGYKDYADSERARLPDIGDYAQQRAWYMRQVSHDRNIRGVVDFGFDTADPTWRSFDLSTDPAMRTRLLAAERHLPIGHYSDPDPVPNPGEAPSMNEPDATAIRLAGDRSRLLRLNPKAALQKSIHAAGFTVVGDEYEVAAGKTYTCQLAEHPATGELRYYWCVRGDWSHVGYLGKAA